MTLKITKQLLEEYSSNLTYEEVCPAIAVTGGTVYWEVEHGLSTSNVVVGLFNKKGAEVEKELTILTPNKIAVSWAAEEVKKEDYTIFIISGGASSGIIIDKAFSYASTNPVQNATITKVIHELNILLHEFNSGSGVS